MKKINMIKRTVFVATLLGLTSYAEAKDAACDNLGGAVILKDTVYGSLTGALITGLAILAADSSGDHAGSSIAAGGAVGAGIGAAYGMFESGRADCSEDKVILKSTEQVSWQLTPTVSNNAFALNWQYKF